MLVRVFVRFEMRCLPARAGASTAASSERVSQVHPLLALAIKRSHASHSARVPIWTKTTVHSTPVMLRCHQHCGLGYAARHLCECKLQNRPSSVSELEGRSLLTTNAYNCGFAKNFTEVFLGRVPSASAPTAPAVKPKKGRKAN